MQSRPRRYVRPASWTRSLTIGVVFGVVFKSS
jgi:hypothetical protein